MGDVLSSFFGFLISIYPLFAVATTELINFISVKLRGSSLPAYVRYALTFGIAAALRFLPDVPDDIDPEAVTAALMAFVAAVMALIKGRDVLKAKVTGDPVK